MESFATAEPTAVEIATAKAAFTAETFSTESTIATVEPTATIVSATAIKSVEPWTSAYKHSTLKVIRSIVPVRSAGIRLVVVISICASGRWTYIFGPAVTWADAYSNSPPYLRVRTPRDNHAKPDQNRIL
jgi:hypothetical protein